MVNTVNTLAKCQCLNKVIVSMLALRTHRTVKPNEPSRGTLCNSSVFHSLGLICLKLINAFVPVFSQWSPNKMIYVWWDWEKKTQRSRREQQENSCVSAVVLRLDWIISLLLLWSPAPHCSWGGRFRRNRSDFSNLQNRRWNISDETKKRQMWAADFFLWVQRHRTRVFQTKSDVL